MANERIIPDDLVSAYNASLGINNNVQNSTDDEYIKALQSQIQQVKNLNPNTQNSANGRIIPDSLIDEYNVSLQPKTPSYADKSDRLLIDPPKKKATKEPTFFDKAIGAGETLLSLGTGLTGGALGLVGGTIGGIGKSILQGEYGTQKGVKTAEGLASRYANALTYQPRTKEGQEYTENLGQLINDSGVVGLAPVGAEFAGVSAYNQPLKANISSRATPIIQGAADAIKKPISGISEYISNAGNRNIGDSVGARRANVETLRQLSADDLPIPLKLTKGEASRDFKQLQFEREAAKNPDLGQPLRDRAVQNNADLYRNFDAFVDETGANAIDRTGAGLAVDEAIQAKALRDKARIGAEYTRAKEAGELLEPVPTQNITNFLDENMSDSAFAPILKQAKTEIGRLEEEGIKQGKINSNGQLTLDDLERLRRFANNSISSDPSNLTNIKFANQLKSVIDSATERAGGNIYKNARRLRSEYANAYENKAVISDLLSNKSNRFSADRKVPFEKIVDRIVFNGSADDLRFAKRTLQTGGDKGKQAFKEIQGATIKKIQEEAFKNSGTDTAGNRVISPAKLDKIIQSLEQDNKLTYLFGKQGAEKLRKINELTKLIATSPAGVVNTSNTASALSIIADTTISSMLTGVTLPVKTLLIQAVREIKNKKIRARIKEALK